ncbi:hypothetical protein LZC95_04095 [Pendulispora brunnea]|uniref:Uncharacterized protein n=1 Tax=Pendulispora brunnea TaxID=2905690 RepID=A0ABZ2KD54_9BACT
MPAPIRNYLGQKPDRSLVALGAVLALGGTMPRLAIGVAGVTTLTAVVLTAVMARLESHPPLELMASLTASALAWGAGVLLAFASAIQALRRDRDEGIRQLAGARTGERATASYLWARVAGLAAALFAMIGGGVALAGLVAMLAARHAGLVLQCAQSTVASLVYAAGFSVTMAPLAMAALGARSRAGGFFGLLVLVFLPELLLEWSQKLLPEPWGELASLPSALASLRGALMPEHVDALRFVRAAVVLALASAIALGWLAYQLSRLDEERR